MSGRASPTAAETRLARALWQAQFVSLLLLALTLPLAEAPKNVACGLVAIFWLLRALPTHEWGGRWDAFDTAFAAMVAAALAAAFLGDYRVGLSDPLRVVLVAWVVKRSALAPADYSRFAIATAIGLWLALGVGYVEYLRGHTFFLELPSVGQVNQSAIYIALLAMLALAWGVYGRDRPRWERAFAIVSAAFFELSLFVTASRAALLAYIAFVAILLAQYLWMYRDRLHARRLAAATVIVVGVSVVAAVATIGSQRLRPDSQHLAEKLLITESMDVRVQIWHLAFEAWRASPWVGHGPETFSRLGAEQVCVWRTTRGEGCVRERYAPANHPHSLYFAALAERGVLGAAALLLLLGVWAHALWRSAATEATELPWQGAAAAFVLVTVAGAFNTTLRVEHGSAALLLLAAWQATRVLRRRA